MFSPRYCIFQFTMGLVSQNCPWLLEKPVVNGNAYLDQKIRYYYVSSKLFVLTNILKKAISTELYIYLYFIVKITDMIT